jgi:hypothetical protein
MLLDKLKMKNTGIEKPNIKIYGEEKRKLEKSDKLERFYA